MQRVAIARALVNEPRLILADEPTGNLDQRNAGQILELLREQATGDRSVVMVTHDHDLAERFADEIVSLVDGQVDEIDRRAARTGAAAGCSRACLADREMSGATARRPGSPAC